MFRRTKERFFNWHHFNGKSKPNIKFSTIYYLMMEREAVVLVPKLITARNGEKKETLNTQKCTVLRTSMVYCGVVLRTVQVISVYVEINI
jgi:hypothetical protein